MARPVLRKAQEAGACYGVERALAMVEDACASKDQVFTLGPLIHNPRVIESLGKAGVCVAESPADAQGSVLVLRTHGVTPAEETEAQRLCLQVIDATCPFVKRVHAAVERMHASGRTIVVIGDKDHPEVKATLAHAQGSVAVQTADEAKALDIEGPLGVVVQTTMAQAILDECMAVFSQRFEDIELVNTICEATSGHQRAATELAAISDVMIIVGGKNSANTTHLAELSGELCKHTYHIESEDEMEASWFDGAKNIGVSAGASTPASHIAKVCDAIRELCGAVLI